MKREAWAALGAAALGVLGVALTTDEIPPEADANTYLRMAEHGLLGEPRVAPFVFRPVVPWVAGRIARASGWSAHEVLRWLAYAAAVLLVWLAYRFVRWLGAPVRDAAIGAAVALLTFSHVKWAVAFPTVIEVESGVVVFVALWAVLARRYALAFVASLVGLFVKEAAALPAALLCFRLFMEGRERRLGLAAVVVAFAAAVAVPRMSITVSENLQMFDPFHRSGDGSALLELPLNWRRMTNLLVSWLGYWLPTLMLVTVARGARVRDQLGRAGMSGTLVAYIAVLLVMSVYGGTNLFLFVSYGLVAQLVVLRVLVAGASRAEIALVLVAVAWFNKAFVPIPLPGVDNRAYYAHLVGGWSDYLTASAWWQLGQVALWVLVANAVRGLGRLGARSP